MRTSYSTFLPLLLLFKILILFPQCNSQCAENVYTDQDFLTCSTNHQLDSSMSAFPSFLKTNSYTKLSLDIIFNPISSCSPSSSSQDLFIITVQDSSGQEMNAMSFSWISGGTYQTGASMGLTNVNLPYYSPIPFAVNEWVEAVASIDLDNQILHTGIMVPGKYAYFVLDTNVPFYSSALKFDSNTKFYFCSSLPSTYSGANFHCSIKTFNIWYTYQITSYGLRYFGSLSPVVLAYYQMNEGTGSSVKDSTGTLSVGSFGTPGPIWSSVGVEFTSTSDYIELPAFPTSSTNPFTSQSFTINFWLKFNSATGSANIFRYTTSLVNSFLFGIILISHKLDFDNFGLYIASTGLLTIGIADKQTTSISGLILSPSVWTLITASYSIASPTSTNSNNFFLYQDNIFTSFGISLSPVLSSGPFRVILGGPNSFLGTIAHLRILTPAVNSIQDFTACSLSTSQCALNLGMSDPSTCVSYPCAATSHCAQCSGGTFSTCLSCSSGYKFNDDGSVCEPVPPPTTPTTPTTPTAPTTPVNPVIKPTQTATSTLSKVYNALTKGSSSGFSAAVAGKIFSNIKYLNIGYSLDLQEALKYWKSSFVSIGLDLNPPQGLQDNIPELGVPPTFEKYGVSSDFFINFWEGIIVLLFMMTLFGIVRALEYFTNAAKHKRFPYSTIRTARFMTQNLLLSQFDGIFGDIILYSVLNYRTKDPERGLGSIDLVISASLLTITIIILGSQFYLLGRYQRLKENKEALEKFVQESQGSLIAFEDFKDTSLLRQSFLFLLIARDFLFSLILTTLFEHPLVQTILILILNLAIVTVLFLKQPFKKRFGFFQQLFYESVTLAVNICVLILAAKDHERSIAYDLRQHTGKFIIITNLVFNFIVIAILVFGIIVALKEAYQGCKAKKSKRIASIAVDTSTSRITNSSNMEMNSNKNQTEVSLKNIRGLEQSFSRIENSRFLDTSGNNLLLVSQPDSFIESQNQDLSSLKIPQTRNTKDLNKRVNHPGFPKEQQNLRENPNKPDRNDYIPQNQTQNFNKGSSQSPERNSEAQNQRKLGIQVRDYSLVSLAQATQRRKVRVIQNNQNRELEIPHYIRGRHIVKKED